MTNISLSFLSLFLFQKDSGPLGRSFFVSSQKVRPLVTVRTYFPAMMKTFQMEHLYFLSQKQTALRFVGGLFAFYWMRKNFRAFSVVMRSISSGDRPLISASRSQI